MNKVGKAIGFFLIVAAILFLIFGFPVNFGKPVVETRTDSSHQAKIVFAERYSWPNFWGPHYYYERASIDNGRVEGIDAHPYLFSSRHLTISKVDGKLWCFDGDLEIIGIDSSADPALITLELNKKFDQIKKQLLEKK